MWAAWLVAWLGTRRAAPPQGRGDAATPLDASARPERFRLGSWFAGQVGAHATLVLFALLLALALSVYPPRSRYRLFVVPVFIMYTSGRGGNRTADGVALAGAAAAFVAFHAWVSAPRAHTDDRFADYSVAASMYRRRGNEAAAEEYSRRRVIGPHSDRAPGLGGEGQ
jgi:hypothetical protein